MGRRGKIILRLAAGYSHAHLAQAIGVQRRVVPQGARRFLARRLDGLADAPGRGAQGGVPPAVAIHMVHLACECPARLARRLSQWDCTELARPLVTNGLVAEIDAAPMRRLWAAHQRKPGRHHLWLSPKHPWEAGFSATVPTLIEFYTRPRRDDAMVLSLDE